MKIPPATNQFRRLAWGIPLLLVFISALNLSGTRRSTQDLDHSWQAALEYGAGHHWQYGTQIIFTYGPLGYLAAPTSLGHMVGIRTGFALFWSLVVTLTFWNLARRLPLPVRFVFFGWLVAFPLAEGLDQTAFWVLASGTLLLCLDCARERRQFPIYLVAFILLALIKTSFFTAEAVSVALVAALWTSQRKLRQTAAFAVTVPLGFAACWIASGQAISHLGAWVRTGIELESGYSGAMNLTPKTAVLDCALVGLVLLATGVIGLLLRRGRTVLTCAISLTLAQYAFLAWKEGFTRSGDWHAYVFLWYLPLGVAFFLISDLPGDSSSKWRTGFTAAFGASVVIALAASHFQIPGFAWNQVSGWPRRFANHASALALVLRGHEGKLYAAAPDSEPTPILEHARDVIGDQPVDVMNYLQQAAIINGLNYQPRPVFQGFVAYTPALQALNEAYFQSPERPRFVILSQQSTDHRFPGLEDSAALNYVLNNYVPVARDGGFLILRQATTHNPALTAVHEQIVHFGESLDLRQWAGLPLFMSIEVNPSLIGRLSTLLYQSAPLSIGLESGDREERYRLVPSMALHPFLLSPVLDSNFDVLNFYASSRGKIVDRVTFEAPAHAVEYEDAFRVTLYAAADFPEAAKNVRGGRIMADTQDRVFYPAPSSIESAIPARLILVRGTAAALVGAPSKIVFAVPPDAASFSGDFGLPYVNSGELARPVRISIEAEDAHRQPQVRFDRTLDSSSLSPAHNRFAFQIPVEAGRDRNISLRTDFAGAASDGNAVSFWSNCRFDSAAGSH